jgi:hypothetical protein
MISQRCPKCASQKVRRGYHRTPFLMKIIFRYYLLCDNCNWEFTGFAVPGTVSTKPKRSKKKAGKSVTVGDSSDDEGEAVEVREDIPVDRKKIKKKVRIKF